ncbi:MAG: hypothetical protein E7643_04140 [Ruminococcaceae bacterium]|nr:hypothetical protein [Oscillospiraceae bacterium]
MAEMQYEFRKRMLEVHKKNRRVEKALSAGQIAITSEWTIVFPRENEFLTRVARDLWDYFLVSMNLCVKLSDTCPADKYITYTVDPTMKEHAYAVETKKTSVCLSGQTERAAAQASYLLEDLMNFEESPYLSMGRQEREPRYRTRMVHSGFSLDIFPNEHLSAIAHQGFTAILLFTRAKDETSYGHTDFNDIIRRAADYGLDTYAYSYMVSEKHPDDEGAEEYYDSLYGELFRRCPGLKGVTLVGESVEFPSKDERTTGLVGAKANAAAYPDRATRPPRPGWFPCRDYPDWLNLVKKVIRRVQPAADIVFWTYNWSNRPRDVRLELIENLPTDISLEATFEMSQSAVIDGVPGKATDYTLFLTGAGEYFTSEAEVAGRRGIPLYSMTNTAGLTWDVGTVPYEPAPYQWLKRFEAVNEAHDKYGLVGLMECHHYGVYPSFISELAKAMFTEKNPDGEEIIDRFIVRDWGREHLDAVRASYRDFGNAISKMITTGEDQYGPMRIGPSYPIVLYHHKKLVIPFGKHAMHGQNAICFPNYTYPFYRDGMYEKCQGESRLYKEASVLLINGAKRLTELLPRVHEGKRDEARRIAGIAEFMGRAVLTTHHVKEAYFRKYALLTDEDVDFGATLDELSEIFRAEIENAKATVPLVEFDSRLGYEPSMDYMCHREALEWKIKLQTEILEEEIAALRADGTVKNRDRTHFPRDMWVTY